MSKALDKLTESFVQQKRYGFEGRVPIPNTTLGQSPHPIPYTPHDFTSNYRSKLSTEWTPVTIARPDPPLLISPSEIYHRHVGQIPNYGGHIPGAMFRFGKTYGNDSRDAKRWLRGDFS